MITQKMADQERPDFNVVFTMILCTLNLLEMLITLLYELIWVSNQKLVLTKAEMIEMHQHEADVTNNRFDENAGNEYSGY